MKGERGRTERIEKIPNSACPVVFGCGAGRWQSTEACV